VDQLPSETFKKFSVKKSEAVPAACHEGTRGERRFCSYSYLTSALDGGEWSTSRSGRAVPLPVPIGKEAGWVPEPVRTQGLENKSFASAGDRTPIVQPVVRHYTAWATAAPKKLSVQLVNVNRLLLTIWFWIVYKNITHLKTFIALYICENSGSHGGEYEDDRLVGRCAV
jgi:hypothetical protein